MAAEPQASKALAVFDIDGTVLNLFGTVERASTPYLAGLAASRGLDVETMQRDIRDHALELKARTQGEVSLFHTVWNDTPALVDHVPFLQPRSPQDDRLGHEWRRRFDREMELFPDVAETFLRMKQHPDGRPTGAEIVFLTDGVQTPVMHRMALCARKIDMAGVLPPGVRFLDLVDRIYTQPDHPAAATPVMPIEDPRLKPWLDAVRAKTEALPPATEKPRPEGLLKVLKDFGRRPDETIMVGDTANDIGVAAAVPGVESVWQKQGADCGAAAIRMQSVLGDPNYRIGVEPAAARMAELGLTPTRVAENGVQDLTKFYRFEAGQRLQPLEPSVERIAKARPAAARP